MFSNDICPGGIMADTVMCPRCDGCKPWILQEACNMSKVISIKYVLDSSCFIADKTRNSNLLKYSIG